jgi:ATP-dependent Clp protease ATP-binding subunit ClpA
MLSTAQRFGLGRVYRDATAEARRRGDRRVGTEHLALALLADPESVTARALGVSLTAARDALRALDLARPWLRWGSTWTSAVRCSRVARASGSG